MKNKPPRHIGGKNNPEYQVHVRQRRLDLIRRYKKAKGCEVCGYNSNPLALEFDHIDPQTKLFNVSSGQMTRSIKSIFAEIRKCRVICANCHRIETYENGHYRNKT